MNIMRAEIWNHMELVFIFPFLPLCLKCEQNDKCVLHLNSSHLGRNELIIFIAIEVRELIQL